MPSVTREVDLELASGVVVSVEITVEGIFDDQFNADADGGRSQGRWLVEDHEYELVSDDDELSDYDHADLKEKVDEYVYDNSWEFDDYEADDDDDDSGELYG